jgi:hypothetical protein
MINLKNSGNPVSIQAPVLDQFKEAGGLDMLKALDVGNGAAFLIRSAYRLLRLICRI